MKKVEDTRYMELIELMTEKNFSGADIHRMLTDRFIELVPMYLPGSVFPGGAIIPGKTVLYVHMWEFIDDAIAEVDHTNYK